MNLLIILANTGVMASASYPPNPAWDAVDDWVNLGFTAWFAAEMGVKVLGLGFKAYMRDTMNR